VKTRAQHMLYLRAPILTSNSISTKNQDLYHLQLFFHVFSPIVNLMVHKLKRFSLSSQMFFFLICEPLD
jgi:hypothetical protein